MATHGRRKKRLTNMKQITSTKREGNLDMKPIARPSKQRIGRPKPSVIQNVPETEETYI